MTSTTSPKRASRSYAVWVDDKTCDGCGICIFFCKPIVFELSQAISTRGVFPAQVLRAEGCTGCRLCELGCPQLAILVQAGAAEKEVAP
jgi:2-oxoglutarate ferredoxin oxidoreductase subunit delta